MNWARLEAEPDAPAEAAERTLKQEYIDAGFAPASAGPDDLTGWDIEIAPSLA